MTFGGLRPAFGLLIALAAALLIAACGGGGPREPTSDERAAIEARFSEYVDAYGAGDAATVCATVSPSIVDEMGGEAACEKAYEPTLGKGGAALADALEKNGYDRIEVADDGSIARMYFPGATVPLRFEPDGDDWYVVPTDAITESAQS